MQLSKISMALLASSFLLLTACGGGGSSSGTSGDSSGTGSGEGSGSGSGSSGEGSGSGSSGGQTSWSTPSELEDGSVTVSNLMVGGTANKPMIAYSKSNLLNVREFDGSNWSAAHSIGSYDGTNDVVWAFNANGKAALVLESNPTNGIPTRVQSISE